MTANPTALQLYTVRDQLATDRAGILKRVAEYGYGAVEPFGITNDPQGLRADLDAAGFTFPSGSGEFFVLLYDFKKDLAAYFATRSGVPVAGGNLQSAIDFCLTVARPSTKAILHASSTYSSITWTST